MQRVLILGGSSYVAQFICQHFLNGHTGRDVQLACTLRQREPSSLPTGFSVASASPHIQVYPGVSLLDLASVSHAIERFRPSVIVNCIAMSSPAACQRDPEAARALNQPTELLAYLEQYVQTESLLYIHFSTDFVYDGSTPPATGYREQDALSSPGQCVYSATKLAFDRALMAAAAATPSLKVIILRIANVVGGRAPFSPNQPPKFAEWLWKELIHAPGNAATPVTLWSDEVRSFLLVHDLVRVVWSCISLSDSAGTHIVNVEGSEALSRVEFANILLGWISDQQAQNARPILAARRSEVDFGYHAPLDARLDCSKLRELLPEWRVTATSQVMETLVHEFRESAS